tara:strand:+ start:3953 stop:4216 length:264 start_codon:yes stop_codon:yes gene_type:complete
MPSKNPQIQKAYKDGKISKGQYDKLSDGLLLGIIKKKSGSKARGSSGGKVPKASGKKGGVKETRHKLGKQAHKSGRPKGGSKVVVEK